MTGQSSVGFALRAMIRTVAIGIGDLVQSNAEWSRQTDVGFALQAFLGVSDSLVWSRGGLGGSWTETSRAFHRSTSDIELSERQDTGIPSIEM